MDDTIRASILRDFTVLEAEIAATASTTAWKWADGVILFPEGLCPFCGDTIRSNRIWQARQGQLLGQWRLVAGRRGEPGRLRHEAPDHPHVSGVSICMGRADSEAAALFLGMNPEDSYNGDREHWKDWLERMFDHYCSVEEYYCDWCDEYGPVEHEHDLVSCASDCGAMYDLNSAIPEVSRCDECSSDDTSVYFCTAPGSHFVRPATTPTTPQTVSCMDHHREVAHIEHID